ncbi:MAG: aspartate--tRNA ligase, partial [Abitibacteriaceae bacterium]|nr:aspartate--tRNA ligase [Abditibacteriaceae bacterium]
MKRTHSCGTLSEANIGQEVTLCGWVNVVRDQSHQTFLDLRDRSGLVQCVADRDNNAAVYAALEGIKAEYCLQLTGSVQARLPGKENPKLATGSIEVQLSGVEVLNTSKTLPFEIVDDLKTDENVRIQYRYLDLRRRPMQYNLETRHRIVKKTRDFLDGEGFWEVETPLLWKSTPEGAKEFMVPATAQPGKSFVLPQSPQISKQLLMVGGVEKYFQIARCFRDEAARADRFLEFTQIDIEMSFVSQDDVLDVTERLLAYLMREVKGQELPLPLPRLTYAEAIRRYGSDKPDTRFGMEFVDISDLAVGSGFKVFANAVASGGQV